MGSCFGKSESASEPAKPSTTPTSIPAARIPLKDQQIPVAAPPIPPPSSILPPAPAPASQLEKTIPDVSEVKAEQPPSLPANEVVNQQVTLQPEPESVVQSEVSPIQRQEDEEVAGADLEPGKEVKSRSSPVTPIAPTPLPPAPPPAPIEQAKAISVAVSEGEPVVSLAATESQPANGAAAGSKDAVSGGATGDHGPGLARQNSDSSESKAAVSTWDKAKLLFSLAKPDELLNDLHDLKYIGAGGYGKVFKAVWRSAPAAVKLVPSHSPELFKSSSYKEALLCKELCHPNIVQTYETRCGQLTEEFVAAIISSAEPQWDGSQQQNTTAALAAQGAQQTSYTSQEFVSGDGFGLPSPVPDMLVKGRTLPEAAAKWKDILFTTGARAGDYLTVIVMDYCDYGSLVRPILKGMFRPISSSGSDREARVRYRALLRTAKEIAQGLEHLHHLQVVHGDLKPGNVLLKGSRVDVRGFNAQVIDFGLAHLVSNSNPQKVSKAGGTLMYAAPEVFSGTVGKAADVYSLGIILWEMVTGSQPYKDLAEGQIVLGVQKGGLRPAWPTSQLPQLQELYEKCVAHDPDSRPKAKEVVQLLTQIEMDLRSELKAAHKQAQVQQAALTQQQLGPPGVPNGPPVGGAQPTAPQQQTAAAAAAAQQQMAALQAQHAAQLQQQQQAATAMAMAAAMQAGQRQQQPIQGRLPVQNQL